MEIHYKRPGTTRCLGQAGSTGRPGITRTGAVATGVLCRQAALGGPVPVIICSTCNTHTPQCIFALSRWFGQLTADCHSVNTSPVNACWSIKTWTIQLLTYKVRLEIILFDAKEIRKKNWEKKNPWNLSLDQLSEGVSSDANCQYFCKSVGVICRYLKPARHFHNLLSDCELNWTI